MATVLERPIQGHATLEDALGGIFGRMEKLERGQEKLQEGQERLQEGQERLQRGLEALAEAHGNFATQVLTILGRESQGDEPAPPGTSTVTSRSSR